MEDLEYVRSSSYRERSSLVIKFENNFDYEKRFDDVRLKVLSIVRDLSERAEPPVRNFLDVNDWFSTVNVAGSHTNASLSLVAKELKIVLSQLEEVREVRLTGDYSREFHLVMSEEKPCRASLTFVDIAAALRRANVAIPAGHAETNLGEFIVRVDEQFTDRNDLFSAIIRRDVSGALLRVGDVA